MATFLGAAVTIGLLIAIGGAAKLSKVIEFFYNDPDAELVRIVHDQGALVFWQVGSADEAVLTENSFRTGVRGELR